LAITLTVCDESNLGERRPAVTLSLPEPTITARELIRARVFEEVKAYNEGLRDFLQGFRGLIQPTPEERALNPDRPSPRRKVDWNEQARIALEAFESNGFLLLVDDRQIDSLAAEIRLSPESQVVFLKLMPLVGG
jgi:hypothetical protein